MLAGAVSKGFVFCLLIDSHFGQSHGAAWTSNSRENQDNPGLVVLAGWRISVAAAAWLIAFLLDPLPSEE